MAPPQERGGLLGRMFCFAPTRVAGEPSCSKQKRRSHSKRLPAAALAGVGAATPPPSPTAAEALAAYLGTRPQPPAPHPCRELSGEESTPQTSTYGSALSSSCDASAPDGYEADSDCPASESSELHGRGGRRFRPALRHSRGSQSAAAGEEQGDGRAVYDLVARFERLSVGSGSGSGGSGGSTSVRPAPAERARVAHTGEELLVASAAPSTAARNSSGGGGTTTCTAELPTPAPHPVAETPGASLPPSRCSSVLSIAPSASGSISLAHFLGSGSGGSSGRRQLRRMGSTQVVLPDSPSHAAADAATGPQQAAGAGEGKKTAVVQRRLSEIHSGHFISLEKLKTQCGDLQEPPGDLLSLMARRVFASRGTFGQGLCSQGLLSDLQADDSRLQTPSAHTLPSPRVPPTQAPVAQQQQQQPEQQAAEEEAPLPQLRRIRTRVGQPRLEHSVSDACSAAGGAVSTGLADEQSSAQQA